MPASPGQGPADPARAAASSALAGLEPGQVVALMIRRADAARDGRQYRNAAALYAEALRLQPDNGPIQVQCGHMFKEAGELADAEAHYLEASRLLPEDADLALQLGHFYKVGGRIREAAAGYERAAALRPGWGEPAAELAHLRRIGWRGDVRQADAAHAAAVEAQARARLALDFGDEAEALRLAADLDRLVPEILPRKPHELWRHQEDGIHLRKFGRRDRSSWGLTQVFRGVEALRGFCISAVPILELQVLLNGQVVHRGPVRGGYPVPFEPEAETVRKYVFNAWIDFSGYAWGQYAIELRFVDLLGETRSHHEGVVIAAPLAEADYPDSNALVTLAAGDPRPVDVQVNARPSVVRPAIRPELFQEPIRNVLVLRTDQLGDMVTSIPAMRRLREILPDARIVGLVTAANVEFAETLGLFDEIITATFPDDRVERRRIMTLADQEALRLRLAPYRFDVAMDLAEASASRPLLLLSGARFLLGFHDREWPWLDAGIEADTRDRKNEREIVPQSRRVMALVERFGAMLRSRAEVVRRGDLPRARLEAFGIGADERYALMHAGARIELARWPHYPALAALVLRRTDLKVVLVADGPELRGTIAPELLGDSRFQLLDQRLQFDDFDALVSHCAAFAGNDSGPKHLASLRGVNVVSLHPGRVNWNEWGQEMSGAIISRKVPCCGCQIIHDPEECGRDAVCLHAITPEEAFAEMMKRV